jgi:hypothetical protein
MVDSCSLIAINLSGWRPMPLSSAGGSGGRTWPSSPCQTLYRALTDNTEDTAQS